MFTQFAALLAGGSLLAVVIVAITSTSASGRQFWMSNLAPGALGAAAVVAIVTTGGSLYLSEVLHYRPCRLCWIQRGFAYPLAILLPIALLTGRKVLHRIALPLAILGALVSTYHIALEHFPTLEGSATCDPSNPCSLIWVRHFGFITIPVMALASFLLHITLALTGFRVGSSGERSESVGPEPPTRVGSSGERSESVGPEPTTRVGSTQTTLQEHS
jgi:disulfide bond formation protein DsbB